MRTRQGSKVFARIRPFRFLWRPLSWIWITILVGIMVNVGSSRLITSSLPLKNTPLGWLLDHLTITLPAAGIFLLLTVLSYLASRQEATQTDEHKISPSEPKSVYQKNRKNMKDKLQLWYQQFLDDSLQQAAWLDLNLAEKPDALVSPVSLLIKDVHLPERLLLPGTTIVQVYEDAHQELMILGEPGSGKSTQLYTLAQHLLTLAETDQMAPLPFVLPLSSWAVQRGPLEDWMAEQLTTIYQMPKKLTQRWVAEQQVLPLLDGLDEMEEQARPLCIQEINRYHQDHPHPLVVCSRTDEYIAAAHTDRLKLLQAIVVQPLTTTQIEATLKQGGRSLAGLRAAYKQNVALQELASISLFLNLLILTYQGAKVRDLPTQGEVLEQQVFKHYVHRMVKRKGDSQRYPLTSTIHWLTFLVRQMRRHNQTTFAIEFLQLDWLTRGPRWAYRWSVGLFSELISGPLAGLLVEPLVGLTSGPLVRLSLGLSVGLSNGLIVKQHIVCTTWLRHSSFVQAWTELGADLWVAHRAERRVGRRAESLGPTPSPAFLALVI